MPRHETARFKLSHGWLRGEDWWGDPVSDNFVVTDMLLHPCVKSMTVATPPVLNALGDTYIVPLGGQDAFAGQDGKLAMLVAGSDGERWIFLTPTRGVRVRCNNPDEWFWFKGDEWVTEDWNPDPPLPIGSRYDVSVSVTFEAAPGENLVNFPLPETMTLPAGAVASVGRATDYPQGPLIMSIRRNGAEVGTVSWIAASVTPTFNVAADRIFAAGDMVSLVMPATVPPNFKNYGITLRFLLDR